MTESRLSLWRQMAVSLESILRGKSVIFFLRLRIAGRSIGLKLSLCVCFAVLVQNGQKRQKRMSPVSTREVWTMMLIYLHHTQPKIVSMGL